MKLFSFDYYFFIKWDPLTLGFSHFAAVPANILTPSQRRLKLVDLSHQSGSIQVHLSFNQYNPRNSTSSGMWFTHELLNVINMTSLLFCGYNFLF